MTDLRILLKSHLPTPVLQLARPRKFHGYCVGAMKTGTLSLASMLSGSCRAIHEPEVEELARRIADGSSNRRRFLRLRNRRLWLEMESNHLLVHFVPELVSLFPRALFVLTVRDCYSWMASYVNHHLTHDDTKDFWVRLRDQHFGPRTGHGPFERPLAERGLHTVDGYLSHWSWHNSRVLRSVPEERLLVVRTSDISRSTGRLSDFLGVPESSLSIAQSHSNRARRYEGVVRQLDRDFLRERAKTLCGALMEELFPEIEGPESAFEED
jgi:hypothetical protein